MIAEAFDWIAGKIEGVAGLERWEVHKGGAVVSSSDNKFILQAFEGDQERTFSGTMDSTLIMRVSAIGSQKAVIDATELVKSVLNVSENVLTHGGFNLEWNPQLAKHMAFREYTLRLPIEME